MAPAFGFLVWGLEEPPEPVVAEGEAPGDELEGDAERDEGPGQKETGLIGEERTERLTNLPLQRTALQNQVMAECLGIQNRCLSAIATKDDYINEQQ
jgi:hypothetical protein